MNSLRFFFLLLILLSPAASVLSQPSDTSAVSTTLPGTSQIEAKIAEVEASSALDETTRATLIERYRRTLANLESQRNFELKARDYAESLQTRPAETAQILARLAKQHTPDSPPVIDATLGVDALNQRLNQVLADLAVDQTRLSELEKQIDQGNSRPVLARTRINEIKQQLDSLDATTLDGETTELAQAQRWMVESQREALWAEVRMLEQELLSQSARLAFHQARRDDTSQRIRILKARQQALGDAINLRRSAEAAAAQQAAAQAQRDAEDKHPVVAQLARDNADISDALGQVAKRLDTLRNVQNTLDTERQRIEEDYRGARQRLEAVGLTKTLGQVLIDSRTRLPDLRQYHRHIEEYEDESAEAILRQIRYREEQSRLRDRDAYIKTLTASAVDANQPELRTQLAPLIDQRQALLGQALDIEDDYIRQLGELNFAAERLIQVADQYDSFLAERLLWVRSAPPINLQSLAELPTALVWFVNWENWSALGNTFIEQIRQTPLAWIGLSLVALLYWRLSWLRRRIRATAEPLRRIRTDAIRHTFRAIALSLIAALPLPLLLWVLGQLLLVPEADAFARAIASALNAISRGLYYLFAFRTLCISGGVAERHFRWRPEILNRIRRILDGFILYILPVSLIAVTVYSYNDLAYTSSLGRLALVASMLGFVVFFWLLINPSRGIIARFLSEQPEGWINRSRLLWFPLIVATPLALALLALSGYVYTAAQLFQSLVSQTWLAMALVLLHQSIVRWLILARRRLAVQAALERQAARRAQAETETTGTPSEVLQIEEEEPDLAALDEQTRRLINASLFIGAIIGLWIIWSDVLPAFNMLERFTLWHTTAQVNGSPQSLPVTAADVGLVMIILFVATMAAKNLPALLEIVLLQSESISAGGRYAIKTLVSYVITAAAFLLAFSTLGMNWSQVQWLVAALSVGIGFGLQEIVANFISGIIILFERPVRVGDIVTIGDITGVVTNIQIRATTIRNWDKQELLVPNKEFITGRLLNWTLTDQQNRITIPVGVAYGSDTSKARELLAEIADKHEKVLADPAPLISFESFGDNALLLVMRCYLASLDGRLAIITELHQQIYETLNANGIGIAFPQRDVHLFASEPLTVRLQRAMRSAPDSDDPLTGKPL